MFWTKTIKDRKTIWEVIASFSVNGNENINEKSQKESQGENGGERHCRGTLFWTLQVPGGGKWDRETPQTAPSYDNKMKVERRSGEGRWRVKKKKTHSLEVSWRNWLCRWWKFRKVKRQMDWRQRKVGEKSKIQCMVGIISHRNGIKIKLFTIN